MSSMELPTPPRTPTDPLAFNIVVEVDLRFEDLAPHRRIDLIHTVRRDNAHIHTTHLDKSPPGNAVLSSFDRMTMPHLHLSEVPHIDSDTSNTRDGLPVG